MEAKSKQTEEAKLECQIRRFIKSPEGRAKILHLMKTRALQGLINADIEKTGKLYNESYNAG